MPDNATDRPLVTFALFSYNQEHYIREAIEAAFAQAYQPLEIILSDNCSDDRTDKIKKEMVKEYDGPHRVILNRLDKNIGTIDQENQEHYVPFDTQSCFFSGEAPSQ